MHKSYRRSRTTYPQGVIGIYDNGGRTLDRYMVVYEPYTVSHDNRLYYPCVSMNSNPFWPQGIGMHGEYTNRPTSFECGRTINFDELPTDCQKLVLSDLAPEE